MDYDERRDVLRELIEVAVPATVQQEVVVAIKGDWFYGAMATRRVGEAPRLEAEELLDTDQLERMLSIPPDAAPSTPPSPTPAATPTPTPPPTQPPPT